LVSRLVDTDRMEAALAGFLALLVVVLDLATNQPWQPMTLDLVACAAAAATPRWPRLAGSLLGAVLTIYIFLPPPWATLGEYALLIPILGTGMRGRRRLRATMSAAYFVILAAISWDDAPSGRSAVIGWVLWGGLIAVLWLIGNVFVATVEAQRQARHAELVLQRQVLARDLHDTVARSLTRVVMAAERARLRGHASDAELATIADAASRGNEELRWVMAILRDPVETPALGAVATATPLEQALAEAESDLRRHGFPVAVSVDGPLGRLTPEQADVLGAVTGEAAGNIIKHAEPDTPCAIIVDVDDVAAQLVFVNRPRAGTRQARQFASMGLRNIQDRLDTIGGHLSVDDDPDQWTTHVDVPLSAAGTPPEQVA
jgi:signal transduction histidine kinase